MFYKHMAPFSFLIAHHLLNTYHRKSTVRCCNSYEKAISRNGISRSKDLSGIFVVVEKIISHLLNILR